MEISEYYVSRNLSWTHDVNPQKIFLYLLQPIVQKPRRVPGTKAEKYF